jgi:polyisoprenyl-phosphate glycosyltransferase
VNPSLSLPAHQSVGIVIPVHNEEEALPVFHRLLCETLQGLAYRFRIYYVNDGSTDQTGSILTGLTCEDERVTAIELSRNFGHQAALTAGIDLAEGDFVITMDGDGQHPPSLIPAMLDLAESGYDLVLTQREDEISGSSFKRATSSLFYHTINRMGDTQILPGGADFRLMKRSVIEGLKQMREYHRFLRGMVAWMGFRTVILPYTPPHRLAGKSKYTLRKMVRLAVNAVFSFSLVPLYIGLSMGALMLLLAVVEIIYVLSFWATGNQQSLEPGWSSLMFILLVVSGIIMILLGFIGVYVGYIFQEVKKRPIYLIRQIDNAPEKPAPFPQPVEDQAAAGSRPPIP